MHSDAPDYLLVHQPPRLRVDFAANAGAPSDMRLHCLVLIPPRWHFSPLYTQACPSAHSKMNGHGCNLSENMIWRYGLRLNGKIPWALALPQFHLKLRATQSKSAIFDILSTRRPMPHANTSIALLYKDLKFGGPFPASRASAGKAHQQVLQHVVKCRHGSQAQ